MPRVGVLVMSCLLQSNSHMRAWLLCGLELETETANTVVAIVQLCPTT